jgi:hypothetical protein
MGLMMPQGLEILPDMDTNNFTIRQDVLDALQADHAIYENFLKFPPLYKRIRIDNIQSYPQGDETYIRRLDKFIENTRNNVMYGDWNDKGRL